jgi:hypothetical protein
LNFSWTTDCSDYGIQWFSLVSQDECQGTRAWARSNDTSICRCAGGESLVERNGVSLSFEQSGRMQQAQAEQTALHEKINTN